jgi:hypothetical protein
MHSGLFAATPYSLLPAFPVNPPKPTKSANPQQRRGFKHLKKLPIGSPHFAKIEIYKEIKLERSRRVSESIPQYTRKPFGMTILAVSPL